MAIMQRFQEGGIFMYFILAFGVLTAALVVERWMALYLRHAAAPADFRARILDFS